MDSVENKAVTKIQAAWRGYWSRYLRYVRKSGCRGCGIEIEACEEYCLSCETDKPEYIPCRGCGRNCRDADYECWRFCSRWCMRDYECSYDL